MIPKADFSDLVPRVLSAVVLLILGVDALWFGGDFWAVVLICAAGLMGFEVSRMHARNAQLSVGYGLLLSAAVLCWLFINWSWAGACAVLLAVAAIKAHKTPLTVIAWTVAIGVSCAVLFKLRDEWGFAVTAWLLLVVVASDIGGYFAGKMIGGPKIMPKVSPNKTWSGTIGGWVLALVVGGFAMAFDVGNAWVLPLSLIAAMAAQTGDLLESLMKRRAGVKDSSSMIPGHGGLLDRFDGIIGASVAIAVAILIGIKA